MYYIYNIILFLQNKYPFYKKEKEIKDEEIKMTKKMIKYYIHTKIFLIFFFP